VCRKSPDNEMSAPPKIRLFPLKSLQCTIKRFQCFLVRHCTFVPYDNLTRLEHFSHSEFFADVACWCLSVFANSKAVSMFECVVRPPSKLPQFQMMQ
ncbi:hypothetical protein TNCV_4280051, partial [Trichonephila clavipes]